MLTAAADGSSLGNPGPAGWAWYINDQVWDAGGWSSGTNNIGELTAVLELLNATAECADQPLKILCDSQYVINSLTKWLPGWKAKGWVKADKKPVQNQELMIALDEALAGRQVEFVWVKGHAGQPLNEAADQLARSMATSYQKGETPSRGPGFELTKAQLPLPEANGRSSQNGEEPVEKSENADTASVCAESAEPAESTELSEQVLAQVVELEKSLLDAKLRQDQAGYAKLLADDYLEFGSIGQSWDKARRLATLAPLDPPLEFSLVRVVALDNRLVLVNWQASAGQAKWLRSSIWRRVKANWQQCFTQATPILR